MKLRQGKPAPGFNPGRRISNATDPDESVIRAKARDIVTQNAQYTTVTLTSIENAIRSLRHFLGEKSWFCSRTDSSRNRRAFAGTTSARDRRRDAAGVVIYSIDGVDWWRSRRWAAPPTCRIRHDARA
jgi:hypothetical protein